MTTETISKAPHIRQVNWAVERAKKLVIHTRSQIILLQQLDNKKSFQHHGILTYSVQNSASYS